MFCCCILTFYLLVSDKLWWLEMWDEIFVEIYIFEIQWNFHDNKILWKFTSLLVTRADVALVVYSRRWLPTVDRTRRPTLCTAQWSIGREVPSRGFHRHEPTCSCLWYRQSKNIVHALVGYRPIHLTEFNLFPVPSLQLSSAHCLLHFVLRKWYLAYLLCLLLILPFYHSFMGK